MINRDYIMRMIEQLSIVLSNVLFSRKNSNFNEANILVDTAFRELIGLDYYIFKNLSAEKLSDIINLSRSDQISAGKLIVAAKLLFEKAGIEEERRPVGGDFFSIYQKSLYLYLEGFAAAAVKADYKEFREDINTILQKFSPGEFSGEVIYKLFNYYKKSGEYNEAENMLFRLKDLNYPGVHEEGTRFYKALEKLNDEELAKANFSRDEIKSGLEDLLNLPA